MPGHPTSGTGKGEEIMADVTNDLLAAVLAATPERKAAALKTLRGEDGGYDCGRAAVPERFVTQRELSKTLGVSVPTLWRYRVPKHTLSGRPRFRVSEVLAYLESPAFQSLAEVLRAERRAARAAKQAV